MSKRGVSGQRDGRQPPRTPALDAALLQARLSAPVLPRDRRAAPTLDRAGFSYPSQESIQEAEQGLLEHGLMLVDVGQVELADNEVQFLWRLTHLASGEEERHELTWPMFSDIGERAHARAACWSHARAKMVSHLLQLRVAAATKEESSDLVLSWQRPRVADVKVTSRAAPPYTVELLSKLVEEWEQVTGVRGSGLKDAWSQYMKDRHPLAEKTEIGPDDFNKLYYWLHDKIAGIT